MAVISISEAARIWSVARSTIQRALQEGRLSATAKVNGSRGIDTAEMLRVFGEAPVALQECGSSELERATPLATDSTIVALQAQVKLLQEQLQEARQREAWLQSIIEQRLLPPPRQGIIERIAEAFARLRRPKTKSQGSA
jgi:predicted site-specific integrase-resolvase